MNFKKIRANLRKVYDDLAPAWGRDGTLHDWGEEELKEFATLVKKNGGKRVLDLGCGSGVQSKMLLEEGLQVVGLDISPEMVRIAGKKVPGTRFVVGDITKIPFRKSSFNGVYARASLLHIPKEPIPKVLKSIHKILRESGVLYLALKEGKGEREVEDKRHGRKVKRFFSFFTEDEIKKLLVESGFGVEKIVKFRKTETSTDWLQVFAEKI